MYVVHIILIKQSVHISKTDFTVDLTWWGSLRLSPIKNNRSRIDTATP